MIYYERVYKWHMFWVRQCADCWDVYCPSDGEWCISGCFDNGLPAEAILVATHVVFK